MNILDRYRARSKAVAKRDLIIAQRKEIDLRRLHVCILPVGEPHTCIACGDEWPCRTIQILDGYKQNEAPAETKRDSLE